MPFNEYRPETDDEKWSNARSFRLSDMDYEQDLLDYEAGLEAEVYAFYLEQVEREAIEAAERHLAKVDAWCKRNAALLPPNVTIIEQQDRSGHHA